MSEELALRLASFDWLARQVEVHGDVLPWSVLLQGFEFDGERVPLVSQQGIFKPRLLTLPLSIRSAVGSQYDDAHLPGGQLHYRYRGTDPFHRENQGLREAMRQHVPLVYLHGLMAGRYLASWPVYVVGDDPAGLTFTVQVDTAAYPLPEPADFDLGEARRDYVTSTFRRRLHQRLFRERVLSAYRERCAMCRLRHRELLDAAHIVADRDPAGEPRVSNGLSLCKLHTPPSTTCSSPSTRTTAWWCGATCSRRRMGRCCGMGCRSCTGWRSGCRGGGSACRRGRRWRRGWGRFRRAG